MRKSTPKVPARGEVFKAIGADWTLYKIDEEQYKLVANQPVDGKANYGLVIKDGSLYKAQDHFKLAQTRPQLLAEVERALGVPESLPQDDKYGDFAIRSGRPLTDEQRWNRHLVHVRRLWLEYQSNPYKHFHSQFDLELAIASRYVPIFGKIPSAALVNEVKTYVERGDKPDEAALQAVERAYYDGQYAPNHMEQLDLQFDIITGVL
jgi:hypothetical protein